MKNFPVIILGHTNTDVQKKLMIECIESFQSFGFKTIVSDHFFVEEIFALSDVYVVNEDNPILTPKDYDRYGLFHASHNIHNVPGYETYTPYSTFAAYSILELIKKGFEQVESDKCLVVNYDFQIKRGIQDLINRPEDATFFRYSNYNAFHTNCFLANRNIMEKFNQFNSIDDYAENMKYMEWWMYDLLEGENIEIIDTHYSEYFKGDLYFRSSFLDYDKNFWLLPNGKVLMKFNDQVEELDKQYTYTVMENGKKVVFHLKEDHFKFHIGKKK